MTRPLAAPTAAGIGSPPSRDRSVVPAVVPGGATPPVVPVAAAPLGPSARALPIFGVARPRGRDAVAGEVRASPARRRPIVGILADAGLPDGAMAGLVLRPVPWLRLHGGGGTNTVSGGVRGGLTFLPFGFGPSLSLEAGRYWDGRANDFVRSFLGANRDPWLRSVFERLGYTFGNAQLGLDFGGRTYAFYVHGGMSYLRGRVRDAQAAVDAQRGQSARARATTVAINEDPIFRVVTPSVKVGLIVFFM